MITKQTHQDREDLENKLNEHFDLQFRIRDYQRMMVENEIATVQLLITLHMEAFFSVNWSRLEKLIHSKTLS